MKRKLSLIISLFVLLPVMSALAQTFDEQLQLGVAAYKKNEYD